MMWWASGTSAVVVSLATWAIIWIARRSWFKHYAAPSQAEQSARDEGHNDAACAAKKSREYTAASLCSLVGLVAGATTFAVFLMNYAAIPAALVIHHWQTVSVRNDVPWHCALFSRAYDLSPPIDPNNVGNGSLATHPRDGGSMVPVTDPAHRQSLSALYAEAAIQHFQRTHRYLALFLSFATSPQKETIESKLTTDLAPTKDDGVHSSDVLALAASAVGDTARSQLPRIVWGARITALAVGGVMLLLLGLVVRWHALSRLDHEQRAETLLGHRRSSKIPQG